MADKRISQLVERVDIANNDVLPIVASGATTTNKVTISSIQTYMQENLDVGVTSVGITIGTSGTDVSVSGSPITTSGNITINIPTASATNRGLLSAADWTTFNNKQDAGSFVTLDTAQTITAQKTFTTSGSSDTMIISHGSGSGFALDVIKAGNGEAIRVTKTSGSGNAITVIGANIEVLGNFVKTGGTSSQFLKADGSVDSSTYLTTGSASSTYVPYSGAAASVNLGAYSITANAINSAGSGSVAGQINLRSDAVYSLVNGYGSIASGTTNQFNLYQTTGAGVFRGAVLSLNSITEYATRAYTLPDADGTIALTSNLGAYLPLAGGTLTGALNGTAANFSGNGTFGGDLQSSTRVAAATGGQQIILTPNLSGTSNRIESTGSLPLEIVSGGNITLAAGGTTPQITLASSGAVTFTGEVITNNGTNSTNGIKVISSTSSSLFTGGIEFIRTTVAAGSKIEPVRDAAIGGVGLKFMTTANNAAEISATYSTPMTISPTGAVTLTGALNGTSASFSGGVTSNAFDVFNNSVLSGFLLSEVQWTGVSSNNLSLAAESGNAITFFTNGSSTERMRITSVGFLKASNTGGYFASTNPYHEIRSNANDDWTAVISHSATSSPYGIKLLFSGASPANSSNYFIECSDTTTNRFRVASNGNVTNVNGSYGAISDIKLKENIQDATSKLDDLMKVKVRNYNLIGDDKKQIGVIAQELEEVFPAMIDESEDFEDVEVPQVDEEGNEVLNEEGEVVTENKRVSKGTTTKSVKYSVFVPMLIKAMQEQQEQIKSLTEQVEALKSQING